MYVYVCEREGCLRSRRYAPVAQTHTHALSTRNSEEPAIVHEESPPKDN